MYIHSKSCATRDDVLNILFLTFLVVVTMRRTETGLKNCSFRCLSTLSALFHIILEHACCEQGQHPD